MKKNLVLGTLLAVSVFQAATPALADKREAGAIVGGIIGGLAGSQIGKGNGNTAAIIVGATVGAVAGSQAGRDMERAEYGRGPGHGPGRPDYGPGYGGPGYGGGGYAGGVRPGPPRGPGGGYPPPPPVRRDYQAQTVISNIQRARGGQWYRVSLDRPASISEIQLYVLNSRLRIVDARVYTVRGQALTVYDLTGNLVNRDSRGTRNLPMDRIQGLDLLLEVTGPTADLQVMMTSQDGPISLWSQRF
jgi:hypothetical protein